MDGMRVYGYIGPDGLTDLNVRMGHAHRSSARSSPSAGNPTGWTRRLDRPAPQSTVHVVAGKAAHRQG